MNRTRSFTAGMIICGLLGVFDVISLLTAGSDDGPPLGVAIAGAVHVAGGLHVEGEELRDQRIR